MATVERRRKVRHGKEAKATRKTTARLRLDARGGTGLAGAVFMETNASRRD